METSKEALQQIFNTFDKDGNGFIEMKEIEKIAKELGQELSAEEAQKIMEVIDVNGDGMISFEEFYQWWYYGKQNQLEKLVYLKFQSSKTLKKVQRSVQKKLGPLLEQKYEQGVSQHFYQLNVGQFEKAKIGISGELRVGQEHRNHIQDVAKYFPLWDDSVQCLVYRVKCQNSELVRLKLEEFITNGLELAFTLVPEDKAEMANMIKETIRFEYATVPDAAFLRVYMNNDMLQSLIQDSTEIAQIFINDETSVLAKVKLELKYGYDDIIEQKHQSFLNLINRGLRVTGEFTINNGTLELFRYHYYGLLAQKVESNKLFGKFKHMARLSLLPLLQNSKAVLNFDSFEQFVQELQLPAGEIPSFEQGLNQAKQMNLQDLLANIPFIADLVEVLRNECDGHYSLSLIDKDASATIHGHSDGFGALWELLVGQ